jgi:hypothetical protein
MKRVDHAERSIGNPALTLNRSRKYQTVTGIPPSAPDREDAVGNNEPITEINSVVINQSAKKTTNLTSTDLSMNPRTEFSADKKIPNISAPLSTLPG